MKPKHATLQAVSDVIPIPYHRQLVDAREWINGLPRDVSVQAGVLTRLLERADDDQRIRAVSLEGSMARGGADELSDLDARIWVADDEFDSMVADLPSFLPRATERLWPARAFGNAVRAA